MAAENPISIDLNEIHAAFGYVPHPQSFRDNPGNLVGLSKVVNNQQTLQSAHWTSLESL